MHSPTPARDGKGPVAVCFDADGTLFHARWTSAGVIAAFCADRGRTVPVAEIADAAAEVAARMREQWAEVVRRSMGGTVDLAAEAAFWREHNARLLSRWGLEDGADDLHRRFSAMDPDDLDLFGDTLPALDRLTALGVRLGVYSNRYRPFGPLLRTLGLEHYFAWARTAADTGWPKPDPRPFAAAATALGVRPADLIYVGDSLDLDARAAAAAGCRGVWLDRAGRGAAQAVPDGVRVVGSLVEFAAAVAPTFRTSGAG